MIRKLIIILLCLICSPAFGAGTWDGSTFTKIDGATVTKWDGATIVSGGACTTANDSVLVSFTTPDTDYGVSTTAFKGQQWTYASNATITQIDVYAVQDAGTGNLIVSLYSDSSDQPASEVANTAVNIPYTSVPTGTSNWTSGVLATPYTYTANTKLHVVVRSDQVASSYSVNVNASGSGYNYSGDSGSSWTALSGYTLLFRVYGCNR